MANILVMQSAEKVLPPNQIFDKICTEERRVDPATLEQVLVLAVELAREGREGRKVGTIFVVGDVESVLEQSKALVLDPLYPHPDELKHISEPNVRETLKELAQLDGAFVISSGGVAVSAARYLNTDLRTVDILEGLGSRHLAAASITKHTSAVAVVVSESSVVRIFDGGELIAEIIPELWLMDRYSSHIKAPVSRRRSDEVTVLQREEES